MIKKINCLVRIENEMFINASCFDSQVLQKSIDNRLNLYSDAKEQTNLVAQLAVLGLSSQPVDHLENGHRKHISSDVGKK